MLRMPVSEFMALGQVSTNSNKNPNLSVFNLFSILPSGCLVGFSLQYPNKHSQSFLESVKLEKLTCPQPLDCRQFPKQILFRNLASSVEVRQWLHKFIPLPFLWGMRCIWQGSRQQSVWRWVKHPCTEASVNYQQNWSGISTWFPAQSAYSISRFCLASLR